MPRIVIVSSEPSTYKGMDRQPLGLGGPIPDRIVMRVIAFEELGPVAGLPGLIDVIAELRAGHQDRFDLLWLGDGPPAGWEHLGFDVGETTSTAWSAIARWSAFLSPAEVEPWHARLNTNGLFARQQDAQLYLEHYLACDDHDRGWTPAGWTDGPDIYSVVSVWRLPDHGSGSSHDETNVDNRPRGISPVSLHGFNHPVTTPTAHPSA